MITILIVDDEKIERDYLLSIFQNREMDYKVVGLAENGEQAILLSLVHKPDVIIMDINLPLLSGLESAQEIRKVFPNQIIILNSAYAEFEFAQQAVKDNLDGYLLKPAEDDTIFSTIQKCYHRKNNIGNVAGDRLDFDLKNFPKNMAGNIMVYIAESNVDSLKKEVEEFLLFINRQEGEVKDYILYLSNVIFSIEQTLITKKYSEKFLNILDGKNTIKRLHDKDNTWEDIYTIYNIFFDKLFLLFESENRQISEIDSVKNYIDKNYNRDLPLEELATIANFSQSYLTKLFKKETEMTINYYINLKRIEKASILLKTTNKQLRDITIECGFNNISHFHRVFKKFKGITPNQIRKEQ